MKTEKKMVKLGDSIDVEFKAPIFSGRWSGMEYDEDMADVSALDIAKSDEKWIPIQTYRITPKKEGKTEIRYVATSPDETYYHLSLEVDKK